MFFGTCLTIGLDFITKCLLIEVLFKELSSE